MNAKSLILCGAFAVALGLGTAANLLTGDRSFSEAENRYLQQLPVISADEVFSGRYSTAFEKYVNDQFWNRDGWVELKTMTGLAMLKKDNGRAYFGKHGYLFEKTDPFDETRLADNIGAVAEFVRRVQRTAPQVNCRVMLVPTAAAIYPELLPLYAPVPDQEAVIRQMGLEVGADVLVDPTGELVSQKAEQLYYRTDHHWTTAGAYTAYAAWAADMGLQPLDRDAFHEETVSQTFRGTIYSKANLYSVPPDSIQRYVPLEENPCAVSWEGGSLNGLYDPAYLTQKDQYAYFLGGNHPLTRIDTGVKNGKTLLLIKDSYANSMLPFLAAHYEKILMVDLRYYKGDPMELLRTEGADDLLFLYNVTGFAEDKSIAAGLS